jgi:hypothetical protein
VANAHEAHGAEAHGAEGQDEQLTETCSFGSNFDASTYNLGLHVGAFFIILFTSSLGKLFILLLFIIILLFTLFFLTF